MELLNSMIIQFNSTISSFYYLILLEIVGLGNIESLSVVEIYFSLIFYYFN